MTPQFLLILGGLAAGWIVVTGLHELSGIVAPIFLMTNLFIVAYPVQHKLNQWRVPRIIGAVVTGLIIAAIMVLFVGSLSWAVAMFVQEIPQYQGSFLTLYNQAVEWLRGMGVSETQLLEQVQRQISPSNLVSVLQSTVSGLTGMFTMLAIVVTVAFVALIDSLSTDRRAGLLMESKPVLATALLDFTRGVRRYWVVSSLFGLIVAVMDVAVLLYLGVPLAWVWGLLAFLTNYIPNVGFVLGVVPPAIMALIANDGVTALIVVIAYSVINFVMQSIIQPKFTGESVGVTATVSLVSLLFWSWALGPLGAILALPATLLLKTVLVDIDPQLRWLNVLFASDPAQGEPLPGHGHHVDPDDFPEDVPTDGGAGEDPPSYSQAVPAPEHQRAIDGGTSAPALTSDAAPATDHTTGSGSVPQSEPSEESASHGAQRVEPQFEEFPGPVTHEPEHPVRGRDGEDDARHR